MTNIAFAKIGKSIKFNSAYSPIGGDNEAPAIFQALANHNPDITFYLVGRSDYSRMKEWERVEMFPYDNVVDCYANCKSVVDKPDYLIDYFKESGVVIDSAVMMIGQIGTVTIPNRTEQVRNRDLTAAVIDMTKNYATPITNWLNESGIPWIEIINDPRYTKAASRDFIAEPMESIGQYDYTYQHNRIKSFDDQDRILVDHEVKYSGVETAFCIGKDVPDIKSIKKNIPFCVVLNEGSPSRYDMLKEWILDYNENVEIYGKWENETALSDSRFRGAVHIDEAQKKIAQAKYTFIIPIRKGWVTSKYIEMIHAGCIPFFHPTYDEQKHIKVPEELRPKTPNEMFYTIMELESNPEAKAKLLDKLQELLIPEFYDGSFLNYTIMSRCIDNYTPPDLGKYSHKKVEVNTLF